MRILYTHLSFDESTDLKCAIENFGRDSLVILSDGTSVFPYVAFHFHSAQGLVNFKNSIIQAYESLLKRKEDA